MAQEEHMTGTLHHGDDLQQQEEEDCENGIDQPTVQRQRLVDENRVVGNVAASIGTVGIPSNDDNNNDEGDQVLTSSNGGDNDDDDEDDEDELFRFPNNAPQAGNKVDGDDDDDDHNVVDIEFPQRQQQRLQEQHSDEHDGDAAIVVEVPHSQHEQQGMTMRILPQHLEGTIDGFSSSINNNYSRSGHDGGSGGGDNIDDDSDEIVQQRSREILLRSMPMKEVPPKPTEPTSRQSTIETMQSHHTVQQGNVTTTTTTTTSGMGTKAVTTLGALSDSRHESNNNNEATPATRMAAASADPAHRRDSSGTFIPHTFPLWVWVQVYKDELYDFIHGLTFNGGDFGCICQLFFDNLSTILGVLYATQDLTRIGNVSPSVMNDILFRRVSPGIGLSLLLGNTYYSYMATRQAKKYGRPYTAQPYGINTVQSFALVFNVICTYISKNVKS